MECHLNNTYVRLRDTSQATAFLSGTVALIKSYFNSPNMPYEEVYEILKNISLPIVDCNNGMPQPNLLVAEGDKKMITQDNEYIEKKRRY